MVNGIGLVNRERYPIREELRCLAHVADRKRASVCVGNKAGLSDYWGEYGREVPCERARQPLREILRRFAERPFVFYPDIKENVLKL